ncbi:hypothetical protein EBU99_07455 [bacterium]|nr:hypothetical protein [bacterium]
MSKFYRSMIFVLALGFVATGCGAPGQDIESNAQTIDSGTEGGFKPYVNPRLNSALDSIFERGSDSNTRWSVEVLAFGPSGEKLSFYGRDVGMAVKPASTMKIMTSWTAFQKFSSASEIGSEKFKYMREMMKYSDNDMAENVLSWCGGTQATYEMLNNFGIQKSSGLRIVDGSGLSYDNRLAAHDFVQVLTSIRASNKMRAFRALLPVGGVDGTLAGRLGNVNGTVAAKTGTLTTDPTTSLSGFADSRSGWQIVFSMLGDSVPSVDGGRNTIDAAVVEIINTLNYLPEKAQSVADQ